MQHTIEIIAHDPKIFGLLLAILSLMVGSFLNVVIARLPLMLEKRYIDECKEFLSLHNKVAPPLSNHNEPLNLFTPSSQCPKCHQRLRLRDNIPIISYLRLRGKCWHCKQSISLAYPCIEALCCLLAILLVCLLGVSAKTCCGMLLTWILIAQSAIDWRHMMIPDEITIPAIWLGLVINCFAVFASPIAAIVGAVAGYLLLWLVYMAFKLVTGKEGIGYGDFKLLAMLGAWLGHGQLPLIVMLSSMLGAAVGLGLICCKRKQLSSALPFGPYLAGAGITALLWGDAINAWYLTDLTKLLQ